MKSSKFSVPVINVGNLNMGGTGKTPHIEYLIRLLKDDYNVATLSMCFDKKEREFIIKYKKKKKKKIGDEPLQFYKKYGNQITVCVEADRVLGTMDLFNAHPDINVLLLDDAFQHRKIHAGVNILLTDYNDPYFKDFIIPVGNLRESRVGKKRADIVIVTKCPELNEAQKNNFIKRINPANHQHVFFSKINYGEVFDFRGNVVSIEGKNIILVTGIANADPLFQYLFSKANILKHFNFGDHHNFKPSQLEEIHNIFTKFAAQDPVIVTTEKDAMRLMSAQHQNSIKDYPWTYQSIEVQIDEKAAFDQLILDYVKKDN